MMKTRLSPIVLSMCLLCSPTYSNAKDLALPDIGDSRAAVMTPEQARRIGEAVVHKLRREGMVVDDPVVTGYLNQLGYKLLAQRDNPGQTTFTFFLVNDSSINAFALPGGFIGVNYGLIKATDTEGELASVLAHEIAHVLQRHFSRSYEMNKHSSLPILAAILAAIVLGAKGNADVGQAAIATAAGATAQHHINFTRHNEEEADRVGIHLLAKAGFDPEMMAELFEKLQRQARLSGTNIPPFLLTHPVNSERITDAKNRAAQLPRPKPHDELTYYLMRNRIFAESASDKQASANKFRLELQQAQGEKDIAVRYGYTLSLIRLGEYKAALKQVDQLLKAHPMRIVFLLAKANIYAKSGQIPSALAIYRHALDYYPDNSALTYGYADALIQGGKNAQAENVLNNFLKQKRNNPDFYRLLARASMQTGNKAASHEALAEYYYQIGQLHQAIDQIKIALKIKHLDFYTTNRLEAQLALIKEEVPKEDK
ncbi:MAG: M48 family metalloprotease [Gammaproteobacteria bacterium]|jgi:beta-barrel assembly-enhancing protease